VIGSLLALGLPGPFVFVGACFIVLGMIFLAVARFLPDGKPQVAIVGGGAESASVELTGPVTRHERAIDWPKLIEPDSGQLEIDQRRRIIEGLAVVGDAWCAQILAAAYDEESEILRESVIDAIGRCAGVVEPTLERAFKSHRIVERYAAIDAASRRGHIALLERGLRDTDGTVALAAAYGLVRARRPDLIDAGLAGRDDSRANEIRRILPVLA